MHVCARSMVKTKPKLALDIAMWHISLFGKRFEVTDPIYNSAQSFHAIKKRITSNEHLVPNFSIKTIRNDIMDIQQDFFVNYYRKYDCVSSIIQL